jgi:hypothetical protein
MGNERNIKPALQAIQFTKSRDSIGHSAGCGLDHQETTVQFVTKAPYFSLSQSIHTGSGAQQVTCYVGTKSSSFRTKHPKHQSFTSSLNWDQKQVEACPYTFIACTVTTLPSLIKKWNNNTKNTHTHTQRERERKTYFLYACLTRFTMLELPWPKPNLWEIVFHWFWFVTLL